MRKLLLILVLSLPLAITHCQVPPILAQMTANISISNETLSNQNSIANVNFNEVDYQVIGGNSIIQLSNSDGYAIQFQLIGSTPSANSYSMANGNTLTGSFTLTSAGQPVSVQVVSTGLGSLEVNSINISNNQITSMSGSFQVNISSSNAEQDADGILEGVISF